MDSSRMSSYYLIKYGETIRLEKAGTPEEACKLAYGLVCLKMLVKNIGRRNPKSYSNKHIQELMKSEKDWFVPIVVSKLGVDN